jgi:hypothetical protein
MRTRLWLPAVVITTVITAVTQDTHPPGKLRGKVTDESGAVVTVAAVLVHPDRHLAHTPLTPDFGEDRRLQVNQKGEFSTMLAPGLYDIVAFAHDFSPQCAKVRIIEGGTEEHNFVLRPGPVRQGQEIDF